MHSKKVIAGFRGGFGFVHITVAWPKMENREQKLNKHLMPCYSILGDEGKGDTICPICKCGCNHFGQFVYVLFQSSSIAGSHAIPDYLYILLLKSLPEALSKDVFDLVPFYVCPYDQEGRFRL